MNESCLDKLSHKVGPKLAHTFGASMDFVARPEEIQRYVETVRERNARTERLCLLWIISHPFLAPSLRTLREQLAFTGSYRASPHIARSTNRRFHDTLSQRGHQPEQADKVTKHNFTAARHKDFYSLPFEQSMQRQ
ncbi:hypothetical protein C8J57DRAFT_1538621 [Mycena rebaudengoi]|nr:hypothetical protein C8J57DRAFT_1538621 [Mycena rebaudengoi]